MSRKIAIALAILACLSGVAHAIPTIFVPTAVLQPNKANQIFDVRISGADLLEGTDLNVLIGGGHAGPVITSIDLTGPGTVFHSNNTGTNLYYNVGREAGASTTTNTNTNLPVASGVLGHVRVSTVGVPNGIYKVALTSDILGPSDIGLDPGNDAILIDGFLVVPEPTAFALAALGLASLAAWGWRHKRS